MSGHHSGTFYIADAGALFAVIASHNWTLPEFVTGLAGVWYAIQIVRELMKFFSGKR